MRAIEVILNQIQNLRNRAKWQRNIEVEAIIRTRLTVDAHFINEALTIIERKRNQ